MNTRILAFALALTLAISSPLIRAADSHAGGHDKSSIGEPGKAASVTRTVRIDMSDAMRYTPSSIDARQGETIRFVIRNSGKLKHELVLGTEKELQEHYEVMKKFPEMEHDSIESRPFFTRRLRTVAAVAVLAALADSAFADVMDIAWDTHGRFARRLSVAPTQFAEACGKLPAGLKVRWRFEASAPLDFNVHYYVGKEVVFPSRLTAVATAKGTLDTRIDQDYCWMWSNKSVAPATITVRLQR